VDKRGTLFIDTNDVQFTRHCNRKIKNTQYIKLLDFICKIRKYIQIYIVMASDEVSHVKMAKFNKLYAFQHRHSNMYIQT